MGTSKVSPIRAVMGFAAMIDALLVVLAGAVLKGLTGNAAFPNPTISLITFANDINDSGENPGRGSRSELHRRRLYTCRPRASAGRATHGGDSPEAERRSRPVLCLVERLPQALQGVRPTGLEPCALIDSQPAPAME